jgi:hypothetical protein
MRKSDIEHMAKENQYSIVAREAYLNIVHKGMSFEKAWNTATEEVITSKSGRDKGCPRATFIGFCESGNLKDIPFTNENKSKNYAYAKFAFTEWNRNNGIAKKEMWSRVQNEFGTTASHQGQLDIVLGVTDFLNR